MSRKVADDNETHPLRAGGDIPEVEVELGRLSSAAQIAAQREGRVDLALTHVPLEDEGILVEQLAAERLCAILPEDHDLARAAVAPAARILGEVCVVPGGGAVHGYLSQGRCWLRAV